jgi:putative endonuclease
MAEHNKVGLDAEKMAATWLRENGYEILHQNWRHSYYEIDIIAKKEQFLHFIEVKARTSAQFGHPEEQVGKKKFKNMQRAADQYLFLNPGNKWIQFSILSITMIKGKEPEFFLLKDVYLK